jgi:excisionase family DNA binding protein
MRRVEEPTSRLLTVAEAAHYLGVSVRFVWARRADGAIPAYKLGRLVRFLVADLDRYIESRREQRHPLRRAA